MTDRKFAALYPGMWKKPGPKCLHPVPRRDRITLYCCREEGHIGKMHLHDVHPDQQKEI